MCSIRMNTNETRVCLISFFFFGKVSASYNEYPSCSVWYRELQEMWLRSVAVVADSAGQGQAFVIRIQPSGACCSAARWTGKLTYCIFEGPLPELKAITTYAQPLLTLLAARWPAHQRILLRRCDTMHTSDPRFDALGRHVSYIMIDLRRLSTC